MKLNTKDSMAKLPGLHQRNGVWTLRVMIPLELQPSYEGRTKLIESLKTGDSAQAKVRGTLRRAELLAEFEQRRLELNPAEGRASDTRDGAPACRASHRDGLARR